MGIRNIIVMARELNKCMTALPIILNTQQYTEYLAIRRGPENAITDAGLIEALRQNASLFVEPQTRVLTKIGTEIPCGGPFQPIYRNLNGRWIMTSPVLQFATTPVDGVELTKEWKEVKPDSDRKLDFVYGGVYDDAAVREMEEFFQTPRATMGVAISLSRQSIHSGLGAMEPGHLFTELEDIEWTFWGQWADFAEKYGGPASITIFSLICIRILTWAGGLCCRCVAMNELYNWATAGIAVCFPSFMACLLARQEGSKRKTTKDDRHRRAWLLRNTPREQLILCRDTDPTFFDAVKSEHLQRHGSRSKLRPETTKGMPFYTGSLPHVGAMKCAFPDSGAYQKCGSVDSDMCTYVNERYVLGDEHRVKKVFWKRKTYTPSRLGNVRIPPTLGARPSFNKDGEPDIIHEPLSSVHVGAEKGAEADMGIEMETFQAPTLNFREEGLPVGGVKPEAVRKLYPDVDPPMDRI